VPAECDVSIRPGWFYHSKEDSQVKNAATLVDLYFLSVGRGGSFLLNLAPDGRGQIPDPDVKSLREFRRILDSTFRMDFARGARVSASNTRGNGELKFSPRNVIDLRRDTYWTADDRITTPELILNLNREQTFNVVRVREYLPLGQRVEEFAVDIWKNNEWQEFARGTSIGNCKLLRGKRVTTTKVRLRITQAPVCPAISELALFSEPRNSVSSVYTKDTDFT
jgi:alpha-L-fucosidase